MNWIEVCDSKVSIARMLGFGGNESGYWGSMKIDCPFAHFHADGGIDKNFRLYLEANTAFCFEENLFLTPSRLYARQHDISQYEAAKRLCDQHGIKPPTQKQLMAELDRIDAGEDLSINPTVLLDAAKVKADYRQSERVPEDVVSLLMKLPRQMSSAQCQRAVEVLGERLMRERVRA